MERRRKYPDSSHDEVPEYWITYSDLLVSLLMAFGLMLFLALARMQQEVSRIEQVRQEVGSVAQSVSRGLEGLPIQFDSASGVLRLDSEVLFAFGSAELRPEAAAAVRRLAAEYLPVLIGRPEIDTMLHAIVIEGHTDTIGSYLWNLRLSQDRAYAVMNEMLLASDTLPHAARLRELLVASGRSEAEPVRVGGRIDNRLSRRIEIHFQTRDAVLLRRVSDAFRSTIGQ